MKIKQMGFTLIELVVVIVILGILAATALPRFAALQTSARIAKLNGAMGAMKGAAALAHAACLATTPQCGDGLTLNMEGVMIDMLNQYPAATDAGIIAAAGINVAVAPGSQDGFTTTGAIQLRVLGNDPANCSFTYTAAAANAAPVFGAITTTGC